jgi:hypothetical protein
MRDWWQSLNARIGISVAADASIFQDARMQSENARMSEVAGRAKGGIARAQKLSADELSESARRAALARWDRQIPTALRTGTIYIGNLEISCAVLPDGTRVLSERALTKAFGGKRGGAHWRRKRAGEAGANLPVFLSAKNISSNLSSDLTSALTQPILYRDDKSKAVAHGLEATLLPKVCRALRDLRRQLKLHPSQESFADQAELIADGLTEVGIIGLVDEATGYQEVRDKQALQEILDRFLRKSLAKWAKRFPDEFYFHIYRLRGWEWKGRRVNPPQVVAYYTNDLVYHRLAPNLVEELDKLNPVVNGRRRAKNTQWLTEDVGHPALNAHLHAVVGFQRVATSWGQLMSMLDAAFPRQDGTLRLPYFAEAINQQPPIDSIESLPLFARSGDATQQ